MSTQLSAPAVLTGFDHAGNPLTRPAKRPITLRHLLTHTAGFGYEFVNEDFRRARGPGGPPPITSLAWLDAPLLFDPGERWEYGLNTDWVGRAVEVMSGQDLGTYFVEHILGPLGMTDTSFVPVMERLAPLHARVPGVGMTPIPSLAPMVADGEFLPGGHGLSGTGGDYMRFLRMILNGGTLDGARILKDDTVVLMTQNQVGDLRAGALTSADASMSTVFDLFPDQHTGWGLGFLINPEPAPGRRAAGSLSWAGLANTHYWIDPASNRAGLMLTQIFPFGDAAVMSLLADFETAVYAPPTVAA